MKITLGQATQEMDIAAGVPFLNVPWTITEGDTVILEGVQAFALATSSDEIKDFATRKMTTYKENLALHLGAKELQDGINNAEKVAGEISNLEVTE